METNDPGLCVSRSACQRLYIRTKFPGQLCVLTVHAYLLGVFTWTRITFRKTFQNVIRPFPDLKA